MSGAVRLLVALLLAVAACVSGAPGASLPTSTPLPVLPTPTVTVTPSEAADSGAPDTPSPAEAYPILLASVPSAIAGTCEPFTGSKAFPPEPGELAEADCDLGDGPNGEYVSYKLFDSPESMNAFYDLQLTGTRGMGGVDGPGCFKGPGVGTWEIGRRFCYKILTDDANVRWTHDLLNIVADALDDDGDWSKLGQLWAGAGPIAP